jgi:hypothetical protein
MKPSKQQVSRLMSRYGDHRGTVVRKRKTLFGGCVITLQTDSGRVKFKSGKGMYDWISIGSQWTVGLIGDQLINIRPGICD